MNNTTPAWTDNKHIFAPTPSSSLPPHCTPTYEFLHYISIATGTCIPTPLAFLSVLLGTLSCISWLFAQLPQLYKNYHIKSTSGLSIFFLIEWCAGDVSNLSGAILTQQATWQIIIGGYYTFVDFMLVAQWIWYEKLKHGRPVRMLWRQKGTGLGNHFDNDSSSTLVHSSHGAQSRAASEPALLFRQRFQGDMEEVYMDNTSKRSSTVRDSSPSKPKEIPRHRPREGIFAIPNYGSFQSVVTNVTRLEDATPGTSVMATPCDRNKKRKALYRLKPRKDDLPSPSPRTVLFLTTLVLVLATSASPLPSSPSNIPTSTLTTTTRHISSSTTSLHSLKATLGPLLSWTSTALYLLSRLPQLLKNHSRRSTAGLSISLFIAAFFGNLFYSASMLANPLFWSDYPAHGCNGWVGHEGSDRIAWIKNAAPFFLGAAGVLMLDAAVAGQFWWFGREEREAVLLLSEEEQAGSAAKASIVSTRLDSERTLVSSRDGAITPTTALLKAATTTAAAGAESKPTSLRSEPTHTHRDVSRSRSRKRVEDRAEPVLVVGHPVPISDEIGGVGGYRWSWKEVDGWMRGWKPSYSNIPLLGEGGGMSGYRSGFTTSRPGTGTGWGGGMKRPKSRLQRQVRRDEEQEEGEDVMEGSETQALLAGIAPHVVGEFDGAGIGEAVVDEHEHVEDDDMEIRHGSGGGVMDD